MHRLRPHWCITLAAALQGQWQPWLREKERPLISCCWKLAACVAAPCRPPHAGWVRGLTICQAVVASCLNMLTHLLWHCSADQGSEQPRTVPQRAQEVWPAGQAGGTDAGQHSAITWPSALRGEHRRTWVVLPPGLKQMLCRPQPGNHLLLQSTRLSSTDSSISGVHHRRQSTRLVQVMQDWQLKL